MKDYTDYVINNKAAYSRAKSAEKKANLLSDARLLTGCNLSKSLTIKELKNILL